jgi:chitinase
MSGGGTGTTTSPPTTTTTPPSGTCAGVTAWSSTVRHIAPLAEMNFTYESQTVYTVGLQAVYGGHLWTAKWFATHLIPKSLY